MVNGVREDRIKQSEQALDAMKRLEKIGAALRDACALPDEVEQDPSFAALLRALDSAERAAPR